MVILIPAYQPDEKMVKLVEKLKEECEYRIVIVDDGSKEKYQEVFEKAKNLGATVITCKENGGKGTTLKKGFSYIKNLNDVEGIITADCDGQHLPKDIIRIGNAIKGNKNRMILGTRHFVGNVPFKSLLGNYITRMVFSLICDRKIYDTQTGLRGFSYEMLDWLCSVEGERFEYEMNMLIEAKKDEIEIEQVKIDTVYIQENKSSHFNPLKDSIKVYLPIIKYSLSSVLSGAIDFVLLLVLNAITSNLFLAAVVARLCSATFNYNMNKRYVFKHNTNKSTQSLPKYILLAAFILLINYNILHFYYFIGLPLAVSKIITEAIIFLFSYFVQKKFVFKKKNDNN
jgi:glycosyltransferase involved in cell wall biosynthesis